MTTKGVYIEFTDSRLQGLTIPLEKDLIFKGKMGEGDENTISMPEYINAQDSFAIQLRNGKYYLSSSLRKKKEKKLKYNVIYSALGLHFFIFEGTKRNPGFRREFLKNNTLILSIMSLIFVVGVLTIPSLINMQNNSKIAYYLGIIGSAYIKDGSIILDKSVDLEALPNFLREQSKVVNDDQKELITSLRINVMDSEGQSVSHSIRNEEFHTDVIIDYPNEQLNVMRVLGRNGFRFSLEDNKWKVSDVEQAKKLMIKEQVKTSLPIVSIYDDSQSIIEDKDFNYSVFYSTKSNGYIYNDNSKYWEGSKIPNLGILKSIDSEKVTIVKGQSVFFYFYNKSIPK